MGRGYQAEEIRQKLIEVLENSESGMSGVEISENDKKILEMLLCGF